MRLLVDQGDEFKACLTNMCPDRHGDWVQGYLEHFKDDLCNKLGLLEIALVVMFGKTNTSRLESLNASIRRMLGALTLQCTAPTQTTLSTLFVSQRLRLRTDRFESATGVRDKNKRKRNKETQERADQATDCEQARDDQNQTQEV